MEVSLGCFVGKGMGDVDAAENEGGGYFGSGEAGKAHKDLKGRWVLELRGDGWVFDKSTRETTKSGNTGDRKSSGVMRTWYLLMESQEQLEIWVRSLKVLKDLISVSCNETKVSIDSYLS
jgi:hypothetical protein